jgi:hypothetical protein
MGVEDVPLTGLPDDAPIIALMRRPASPASVAVIDKTPASIDASRLLRPNGLR